MVRPERNPVRARTEVRNRAGFRRERGHAALVDVSLGANSSDDTVYLSTKLQPLPPHLLNFVCAKAVKYPG